MVKDFYPYMRDWIKAHECHDVVEAGSDFELRTAFRLAPSCEKLYSVNFPHDHERMLEHFYLHREIGRNYNVELLSGNILELSNLINRADLVLAKDLLVDSSGKDIPLLWAYNVGKKRCTNEDWSLLWKRFSDAEESAYNEFFKVANPGYVAFFNVARSAEKIAGVLENNLGISPARIERVELREERSGKDWILQIVDNFKG